MSTRPKPPRKWKTYDDEKKERIVMQIDNDLQSDKVTIKAAYKRVEINQTQYDHWQQKCIICLEFYHKVDDLFEICPAHTWIYAPCTVTQLMVKSNGTFSYPDYRNTTMNVLIQERNIKGRGNPQSRPAAESQHV